MKPSILIVGSSNTDMVIMASHLPEAGETILGGRFFMNAGGKGANQAVAAQRLGGNVTFICKTGTDIFGQHAIRLFELEGINTDYIISTPDYPSGVALITVDKNGENCIVVASGANAMLIPSDLQNGKDVIKRSSIILMQLEIPVETVDFVANIAKSSETKIILNPAPACELPSTLLQNTWMITPNEKEAEMLSGINITDVDSAIHAATLIHAKGVVNVIITLGGRGALLFNKEICEFVPAPGVNAVDTTAAGDVFNGALAVALCENTGLLNAVRFACDAASLSVTKPGAQASVPYRNEVDSFLKMYNANAVIRK